jgi:hypothetical protein
MLWLEADQRMCADDDTNDKDLTTRWRLRRMLCFGRSWWSDKIVMSNTPAPHFNNIQYYSVIALSYTFCVTNYCRSYP